MSLTSLHEENKNKTKTEAKKEKNKNTYMIPMSGQRKLNLAQPNFSSSLFIRTSLSPDKATFAFLPCINLDEENSISVAETHRALVLPVTGTETIFYSGKLKHFVRYWIHIPIQLPSINLFWIAWSDMHYFMGSDLKRGRDSINLPHWILQYDNSTYLIW